MSTSISGVGGQQNQPVQHQHNVAQAVVAKGEWKGTPVAVSSTPSSLLADAAEEMTFAASETVEKDVADRRRPERQKKVQVVVPPTEEMAQLQHQMAERLAKLLTKAKAAMGNPAAFREAMNDFPDPTEQHAALLWLEERLSDQPSLAALARQMRENLEAEQASAIQAGYNVMGVETDAEAGTGADLYRRAVLSGEGIAGLLESIISKGGEGDFATRAEYLFKAVGRDLSAANPSTEKAELEAMNNDLYHLRALANFTRDFSRDIGRMREEGNKPPLPNAGLETVRLLCRVKDERLATLDGLKVILRLEGEKDPLYDVKALTRTFKLAHSLPNKLFADNDSRQRLLDGVQGHLDAAVDLEEDMQAEGD